MKDDKVDVLEPRSELERVVKRRFAGVAVALFALMVLLSLISYDWRDVSVLCVPVLSPCSNLFGEFGAWLVFIGYFIVGLAFWFVPVFLLLAAAALIFAPGYRLRWRVVWAMLLLVVLAGFCQMGSNGIFATTIKELNIGDNAGGAVGYALATRLMTRWFSPFGGGVLMAAVAALALVMMFGVKVLIKWAALLNSALRQRRENSRISEEAEAAVAPDGLTDKERRQREREAEREALRAARAEAKKAREEERQAKRELKEREKQERAAEQDGSYDVMIQHAERIRRLREKQEENRLRMRNASEEMHVAPHAEPPVVRPQPPASRPAPAPVAPVRAAVNVPAETTEPFEDNARFDEQEYSLPPIELLNPAEKEQADSGDVQEIGQRLIETLQQFNVEAEVDRVRSGPVVTRYELRPGPAVRVSNIKNLAPNIQMALEATSLRIEAPIPGRNAVGIEVPNQKTVPVLFRDLLESSQWEHASKNYELPIALGKDVAGNSLIIDLAKAPHMLVAGATGSGKSVCLNTIITGFLMSRTPQQLRLILIDPKRVEFANYNDLPHLSVPVINDSRKVAFTLRWAIVEMNRRYKMLQACGHKNIVGFNNRPIEKQGDLFAGQVDEGTDEVEAKLPYIVIIIDEVADIMAEVGKDIEGPISRLCAKSRAVGIHLILATQRPSVDVITGTIKSNIPGRIAFKVSQGNDSRTILDTPGAETLLGYGDMLYLKEGSSLLRAQGAYLKDEEIERVVDFVKQHCRPCYDSKLSSQINNIKENDDDELLDDTLDGNASDGADDGSQESNAAEHEQLIRKALEVIRDSNRASISFLQRKLSIGYNRAASIIEELEDRKILGASLGTSGREILVDLEEMLAEEGEPPVGGDMDDMAEGDGFAAQDALSPATDVRVDDDGQF